MSLNEAQAKIKAQIWQSIAQGELDLSAVPKEQLTPLVDLVTEAALVEMNQGLDQSLVQAGIDLKPVPKGDPNDDVEVTLWEGRPFLSITTYYMVTDERIRIIHGLLGKTRTDIELVRVQSIDQKQTFSERMLKLGDITIRSHDPNNPLIILNNISEPEQVHEILRRAVLAARDKYKLSYREEM